MKKIFIWGAGEFGMNLLGCFDMSKTQIVGFIDSNKNKINKKICGYEVVDVHKAMDAEFDYVFISSVKWGKEIYDDAIKAGVSSEKIISMLTTMGQMGRALEILNAKGLAYINFLHLQEHLQDIRNKETLEKKCNRNTFLKRYYEMQAAEFIAKNFVEERNAPGRGVIFENRKVYRDYIIDLIKNKDGLFLEFGVYQGKSINYMSERLSEKKFYGFDSFLGLPEDWHPGFGKGEYDINGAIPPCNNNVQLIKGWFDETLPNFMKEKKGQQCSYIHIDCDLYSSAKYVLEQLKNNIGKGTIICFDEFCGFIGWQQDEYKAFNEFIEENKFEYKYIACSYAESAGNIYIGVAVEII